MRPILILTLLIMLAAAPVSSALASPASPAYASRSGTPPPADTPGARPSATATGSPWLAVLVFSAALAIYMFIKSRLPANTITTTTCLPLIDPAKMEAEKRRIAEEEAAARASAE